MVDQNQEINAINRYYRVLVPHQYHEASSKSNCNAVCRRMYGHLIIKKGKNQTWFTSKDPDGISSSLLVPRPVCMYDNVHVWSIKHLIIIYIYICIYIYCPYLTIYDLQKAMDALCPSLLMWPHHQHNNIYQGIVCLMLSKTQRTSIFIECLRARRWKNVGHLAGTARIHIRFCDSGVDWIVWIEWIRWWYFLFFFPHPINYLRTSSCLSPSNS